MKKSPKASTEPEIEKCELRLDYCEPESHPIPPKGDGSVLEEIRIYGKFADVAITQVTFSKMVKDKDGKEELQKDGRFIKEGTVKRVQFNQILVPVRIYDDATPGTRYFTVTQGKTVVDGKEKECTVENVDLTFKLT